MKETNNFTVEERLGSKVFRYCGYQIPILLGYPKLSFKEIDKLIKNKDYKYVAQQITTLADAVAFVTRGNFKYNLNSEGTIGDGFHIMDIGHVVYDDEDFLYPLSGYELMSIKQVQCLTSTTLLHYLIAKNYDEFGYIILRGSEEWGHSMAYIKAGGKYHLINPTNYFDHQYTWLPFYEENEKLCCDTLEELMHNLIYGSDTYGCGDKFLKVYTVISEGLSPYGNINKKLPPDIDIFPLGQKVTAWLPTEWKYVEAKHNWKDENYVVGYINLLKKQYSNLTTTTNK